MTACVVDASVAAKWFLPTANEPLSAEAAALLARHAAGRLQFFAPDLLWPEVGNVLWKAVRQRRMTSKSALDAIRSLETLRIAVHPSLPVLQDAFEIARAFDRTVYDSLYVAVALVTGSPLVTADERLASALAVHLPVRWLGALL